MMLLYGVGWMRLASGDSIRASYPVGLQLEAGAVFIFLTNIRRNECSSDTSP
jgi:hypothetical protein